MWKPLEKFLRWCCYAAIVVFVLFFIGCSYYLDHLRFGTCD